jgi:hypothetical protein
MKEEAEAAVAVAAALVAAAAAVLVPTLAQVLVVEMESSPRVGGVAAAVVQAHCRAEAVMVAVPLVMVA